MHLMNLCLFVFAQIWMASAQFQFFDGMFGQRQQQQQQPSGASQWATHADSTSCSEYLCPATLACVARPEECPCPHVQDVKCLVPDGQDRDHGTVLCVRGGSDCAAVEQLGKKFTK